MVYVAKGYLEGDEKLFFIAEMVKGFLFGECYLALAQY